MTILDRLGVERNTIYLSLSAGVIYTLVLYLLACQGEYALNAETTYEAVFYLLWMTLGHILVMAFPVFVLIKEGYVLPILATLFLVIRLIYTELIVSSPEGPLMVYGFFWILPLLLAISLLIFEHLFRTYIYDIVKKYVL